MNLIHIRYFCSVVQTGSITLAAKSMDVSQPAVSYAIREMEKEFGLVLFARRNKALQLTDDGKRLYDILYPCLKEFDDAVKRAHSYAKSKSTVRVAIPLAIGGDVFASVVPRFQSEYPETKISVREASYQQAAKDVASGKADIAIAVFPPDFEHPGIKIERVAIANMCFAVSSGHPLANRETITFEEIANCPIAYPGEDSTLTLMAAKRFEEKGITPNIILSSSQFSTIMEIIHYGSAGTFLFPDSSQAIFKWLRLIHIVPAEKASVGFFLPEHLSDGEHAKQIVDYARKVMKQAK